jgi:hypothetical protein
VSTATRDYSMFDGGRRDEGGSGARREARSPTTGELVGTVLAAFVSPEALRSGWVNVNESTDYWESHLPFGGHASPSSGLGRVGGRHLG